MPPSATNSPASRADEMERVSAAAAASFSALSPFPPSGAALVSREGPRYLRDRGREGRIEEWGGGRDKEREREKERYTTNNKRDNVGDRYSSVKSHTGDGQHCTYSTGFRVNRRGVSIGMKQAIGHVSLRWGISYSVERVVTCTTGTYGDEKQHTRLHNPPDTNNNKTRDRSYSIYPGKDGNKNQRSCATPAKALNKRRARRCTLVPRIHAWRVLWVASLHTAMNTRRRVYRLHSQTVLTSAQHLRRPCCYSSSSSIGMSKKKKSTHIQIHAHSYSIYHVVQMN